MADEGETMLRAEWLAALRARLAAPLPGVTVHMTMAPSVRRSAEELIVTGKACREGGVLILLYPGERGEVMVALMVRPQGGTTHAGQVSLPGGRREAGESLVETALREAYEELGIEPAAVTICGSLSPIYVPPSNFCVYPTVGYTPARPSFQINPEEVAGVLEVPLGHLAAPHHRQWVEREIDGLWIGIPHFLVDGYEVWGATAMILAELLAVMPGVGESKGATPSV